MMIKLMVGDNKSYLYECDHIGVTELEDCTIIELVGGRSSGAIIRLPEMGKLVYVQDDAKNKTRETYRWPQRRRDDATGKLLEPDEG